MKFAFVVIVVMWTLYTTTLSGLITRGDKFPMQPNGLWGESKIYECKVTQQRSER